MNLSISGGYECGICLYVLEVIQALKLCFGLPLTGRKSVASGFGFRSPQELNSQEWIPSGTEKLSNSLPAENVAAGELVGFVQRLLL